MRRILLLPLILSPLMLFFGACAASKVDPEAVMEDDASSEIGPYQSEGLSNLSLKDPQVRAAMSRVPRHEFVPQEISELAYKDRALPIGHRQTISQPYIVALMTQESGIVPGSKVLEVGTGSGFQAAVLEEMGARVFSLEIIPEMAEEADLRLKRLGYSDVQVRQGDGWDGWEEEAPFDAILVTAAAPEIPHKLLSQLANRGRLLIPLENSSKKAEQLLLIERQGDDFITKDLGAVRFVPLVGQARARLASPEEEYQELLDLFEPNEQPEDAQESHLQPQEKPKAGETT